MAEKIMPSLRNLDGLSEGPRPSCAGEHLFAQEGNDMLTGCLSKVLKKRILNCLGGRVGLPMPNRLPRLCRN